MITKRLFRSPLHEHADHAQRVLGASKLPPDSNELATLLATDPAPEVRAAAASRSADVAALAAAWRTETDPTVRAALAAALGPVLAETQQSDAATALLESDECTDAIRSEVARRAPDADRRRIAIAALRDENALVEVAIGAEHAATRMAAAERVHSPEGLHKLADAARNKDHGVARLARKRIEAIADRAGQAAEADAILAQLDALAATPGAILTAVIELDRRWEALDDRRRRCPPRPLGRGPPGHPGAIRSRARGAADAGAIRAPAERLGRDGTIHPRRRRRSPVCAPSSARCAPRRNECADRAAQAKLDDAERRIELWAQELQARAEAEALVAEAEQLAAGTSIDDAKLPERWQALDRAIRTPALTRRFEAALIVVEQRRLAQIHAAEAGGERGAAAGPRPAARRRAGARGRPVAGCPRRRGRDQDPEARCRTAAEADGAAVEPARPATRRARALGIVRAAARAHSAVRARRGRHDGDARTRRGSRPKSRSCATSGRRSTSSTRASPRRCGSGSIARARRPMPPPPGTSPKWPRGARESRKRRDEFIARRRRTRRRCSPSPATGARSSTGCAKRIAPGATAISAASNPGPGRVSMPASRPRSRRCAMRWRRRASRRRRSGRR